MNIMKWIYTLERREGNQYFIGEFRHYLGKESAGILIFDITDEGLILKEKIEATGKEAGELFNKYST